MSLPKHTRTSKGTFRQESGNSRAKNLAKDYPEFEKVHPETKLETLREKSGPVPWTRRTSAARRGRGWPCR